MTDSDLIPGQVGGRATEYVTFVKANVDAVAAAMITSMREQGGDGRASDVPEAGTVLDLVSLYVVRERRGKLIIFDVYEGWSMFIAAGPQNNSEHGTFPTILCNRHGMLTVQATVVGPNVTEPAVMLQVWDPGHIEGPSWGRRYLYAMRDGGRWAFSDHGSRYDFEDVTAYGAKRVRDRFTI